eukprot:CAMPEP_0197465636 /NCGR_PEP_ID=MMETSP1175-20131217/64639_1 /TAXON_ID=1003142 /ORGANISM="Triceratium dubium, Strain CCMP147" /LENGTH=702 /DNA_ID=CAMNT_0043001655 /DNA_START=80 /DNA_END=2188 /DNA_ORIENTATION=-
MIPPSRLLLLAAFAASVSSPSSASDAPECRPTSLDAYDYVVIGAGTAGSVAASSIASSLPTSSVLLVDLGRDRSDTADVMNNDRFADMMQSPNCEHHFTREAAMGGAGPNSAKKVYLCVSKMLGGASSINYGGWYRAPQSDLDEWATLAGSDEWNYDSMLPYFKHIESLSRDDNGEKNSDRGYEGVVPVLHQNISIVHHEWATLAGSDEWNYDSMLPYFKDIESLSRDDDGEKNSDRGYDGVVPVLHQNISIVHLHTGLIPSIERHLGVSVGDQDNNGRTQEGVNTLQVSRVRNGCWTDDDGTEIGCADWMRNGSAYNAFVRDPMRSGGLSNLEVLEGSKVVKLSGIGPDDEGDISIEYIKKGYRYVVSAKEEVLLSAGSWGNPKISMLSGVGDSEALTVAGVTPVVNSPGVGRHLMDHGVLWLTAMLGNVEALDANATAALGFDPSSFRGKDNPLPALMGEFNAINLFFKSDDSLDYPDMELLAGAAYAGPGRVLLLLRVYQNRGTSGRDEDPASGGSLKLRSDDPGEEMDATRNWYADDESITPMLNSLKKVIAMVNEGMAASQPMLLEPNAFAVDLTDDEALKKYIRDNAVSEMHLMGSMRMGTDDLAVVDSELRMRGTNGRVRVADTSVFPTGLRGHPMATAMAVGARAADFIVADAPDDQDSDGGGTKSGGSSTACAFATAATAAATTCAFAAAVAS